MRSATTAAMVLLLGACGTLPGTPGYISSDKSTFDGSTDIRVEPGSASGCCMLGASWNSSSPQIVQITAVTSRGTFIDVGSGSMEFNIDGRIVAIPAIGQAGFSARTFAMPRRDFQAALSAGLLRVRVHTPAGPLDGDLLRDVVPGSAILGFRNLARRLP